MDTFEGKVAIVTGAASGIGRALGEQLATRGAHVILADINVSLLEEVAESLQKAGSKPKAVTLDATDSGAVEKLVKDTTTEHDRLDFMFNNAGIGIGGEARDLRLEDWKKVIDINLYGVINGVAAAYPVMARQGFGHIINTASSAGLIPLPGGIPYTVTKYGVVGLSHALRVEGDALGVRVSVVCPGVVHTAIFESSKVVKLDRDRLFGALPKGVTPEECARIILRGVERNKPTIVVTARAKIFWLLHRLSPDAMLWIGKQYMKKFREARIEN